MNDRNLKPGWTRVAFGDVVRQVKDRVEPVTSGLKCYVAGDHMDTGDLHIRRWGEIGDGYLGPAFHMRFRPGQVLYGSRRTYLRKVAVADFAGITANTTFVLESKDSNVLLPDLLPFVMSTESFHKYSIEKSKGSVNPYVNFSDLAAYEFALPPLQEQYRISTVLNEICTFDFRLSKIEASILCLRAAHLKNLEQDRDFKRYKLGHLLADIEPGRSLLALNQPPKREERAVLKISAVSPHGFRPDESKVLMNPDEFSQKCRVRNGDLLMTRSNTPALVGETTIVDDDYPNLMLSDKVLRLARIIHRGCRSGRDTRTSVR